MAKILHRMETITRQIADYEMQYSESHNESEKRNLQRQMRKLTTEYIKLSEKL